MCANAATKTLPSASQARKEYRRHAQEVRFDPRIPNFQRVQDYQIGEQLRASFVGKLLCLLGLVVVCQ
jgi:hypothetical protein